MDRRVGSALRQANDMKIKSYKELDIWKKGIGIADLINRTTGKFPQPDPYEFDKEFKDLHKNQSRTTGHEIQILEEEDEKDSDRR
jgi:hypothetical protein